MSRRVPPKHPFGIVRVQGREVPALILCWVYGRSGQPEAWFACIVVNSINEPGRPVEMMVAAEDIRPVR